MRAAGLSDPVTSSQASPDGRWIAFSTTASELYIVDLKSADQMFVASSYLGDGFAWSPDSQRLAYVEHRPNTSPSLRVLPAGERQPLTLVARSGEWIGQVGWLDADRIVYQTDRNSDHITLWTVNIHDAATEHYLDARVDITDLWTPPGGGRLLYATIDQGKPALWRRDPGGQATRVVDNLPSPPVRRHAVAFHPRGDEVYVLTQTGPTQSIRRVSVGALKTLSTFELPTRAQGIAVSSENEVFIVGDGKLAVWRPDKRLGGGIEHQHTWRGLPLAHPASLGSRGLAAVVNGSVLVTGASVKKLEDGRLFSREFDDILKMALDMRRGGHTDAAVRWIDSLLKKEKDGAPRQFPLQVARAWLERSRDRDGAAGQWIERATATLSSGPDSGEIDFEEALRLLWSERALLKFFGEGDSQDAAKVLAAAPESVSKRPLGVWIYDLIQTARPEITRLWRNAGAALRHERWAECGAAIQQLIVEAPDSQRLREGIGFMMEGAFDPLEKLLPQPQSDLPFLMADTNFQRALLNVSSAGLTERFGKRELRELLMVQWALSGQIDPARLLAKIDLSDPEGHQIDYLQILQRYLTTEEEEPWITRAVAEALLEPGVQALLDQKLKDARGHLTLLLSRAKLELTANDLGRLDKTLTQAERDMGSIPPAFWNSTSGALLFHARVFRGKWNERRRDWAKTLEHYEEAEQIMERFPGDWGTLPLDLELARALVESGRSDSASLGLLLQTLRGSGDPLINPTHQPDPLLVGISNLDSIESAPQPKWMKPYISCIRGSFLSLLGQPYQALTHLRTARRDEPPTGLLARSLFEEASVRASLGQHRLAAQLLAQLTRLKLTPAALALAIQELAQAERAAGLVESQEARIRELAAELQLPDRWTYTMVEPEPPSDTLAEAEL